MDNTSSLTISQVLAFVRGASANDRSSIVDALNYARQSALMDASDNLRVGDKVTFNARGRTVVGYVVKKNRTTVAVRADVTKVLWRVTPTLLKKVV